MEGWGRGGGGGRRSWLKVVVVLLVLLVDSGLGDWVPSEQGMDRMVQLLFSIRRGVGPRSSFLNPNLNPIDDLS